MLLQAFMAPKVLGETSNVAIAPDIIASNNQQVQQVLSPQPSPEELAAQSQQQMPDEGQAPLQQQSPQMA